MHLRHVIAALTAVCALIAPAAFAAEQFVTGGIVRGEDLADGSTVYRGIPYAAPPAGPLRWKPPQPVIPWQGVRDAIAPAPTCAQHSEGWNESDVKNGSEDCLYLSLHAPKHAADARLPVIFWIHGGSNRAGSGYGNANSPIYQRGVVLVSIEYRLGVFGFLATSALTAESPQHSSGNYALLDQIAALAWVRDNIAKFGGDPGNVTIAGQSAGAYNVGVLLLSPLARGLFHKAILESGTPGIGLPPRTPAENEKIGADLARAMGAPDGAEGLRALRAAPAAALIAAGDKLVPPHNLDPSVLWLQPMVDGWVLPRPPIEILQQGGHATVPLIVGNNTREFPVDLPPEQARAMATGIFQRNTDAALALYGVHGAEVPPADPVLGSLGTQVITDLVFRCPLNWLGEWHVAAGRRVWRYEFGVAEPGASVVAHNAELKYVFDAPAPGAVWPPVQEYWTNFAKTGDPNEHGLPIWRDLGDGNHYMAFTLDGPQARTDLRGAICRMFKSDVLPRTSAPAQ